MRFTSLSDNEVIDIVLKHKIEFKNQLNGINIPFGCEIEFEGVNYNYIEEEFSKFKKNNKNLNSWKIVDDDSLIPEFYIFTSDIYLNGGEIVSPKLNNKLEDYNDLKIICHFLKEKGAKALDYSAAHLHFDNKLFKNNYEALKHLLKLWAIYEDVIFRFSSGFKDEIRTCASIYAKDVSNKIVRALYNTHDYEKLVNELNQSKTNALSLYNFDKENDTFEFRCPNGTLSETVWQNNINFFKHLLEGALSNNKEWDKVDYMLNNYIPCNYSLDLYNMTNIKKASSLADFIYSDIEDKKSFMKQYLKR